MSKVRIYELAKEMGISNKDMLTKLHEQGVDAHTHMSSLEDSDVQKIKNAVKPAAQTSAPAAKPATPPAAQPAQPAAPAAPASTPAASQPTAPAQPAAPQGESASRPQGQGYQGNRPQGDRPAGTGYQGNRPQGDRPAGTGYQGNRPHSQRPQGGTYKPMSQNPDGSPSQPQGDRPAGTGYQGNRPQGDRPAGTGYQGNRPQGDRPAGTGYQGNRPQGDRPAGTGYQGNRPQGDRPAGTGYQGNRPQGDRPAGTGYQGNRPQGDRPAGTGYQGSRPQGERPAGTGYQGNRPQGDRPAGTGYQGNRPAGTGYQGNRPQGDRPAGTGYQGNRPAGQGGYQGNRPAGQGGGYGGRPQGNRPGGLAIPAAPVDKKEAAPLRKQRTTSQYNEESNRAKQDRLKNERKKPKQDIRASISDYDDDGKPYPKLRTSTRRNKAEDGGAVHSHEKKLGNKGIEALLLPDHMTLSDFANKINRIPKEVIVKLMNLGIMAGINHELDFETMELLAVDFGIEVQHKTEENIEKQMFDFEDDEKDMIRRAPVVTVMGHVDHGKTSLLDAIRNTSITTGEAGGITQHIGASEVEVNGQKIVFLDTPGHEAFTTLRARGSKITDIAILVVAADDGVMPQTIEAIDHAKAAGIPIIVAVNKIDKPGANPDKVKQELSNYGVQVEDWGGDTVSCMVSAKVGTGIDNLLEMVLLVAELQNLKANPNRPGNGSIIEAHIDKGQGPVATVLVQNGTLKEGDSIIAGATYGRIRAMFNDKGKRIQSGGPSSSAEILGLSEVPQAGDKFYVIQDEKKAKQLAERRQQDYRELGLRAGKSHVTLEDLFSQIQQGNIKELNIILKADVHGSLEALKSSLLKLTNEEVRVNIIHASIGTISESDILLASASNAIIIGFNVRPSNFITALADKEQVDVRTYQIIYNAINDIETAMKGMLDPIFKEVVLGKIEVRATFKVPNRGMIAGGYVLDGKVTRTAQVRVIREGIIIHDGKISSLKRFKDDVKEVATSYECGIGIEGYNDLKEQDIIEAYIMEEVKRS